MSRLSRRQALGRLASLEAVALSTLVGHVTGSDRAPQTSTLPGSRVWRVAVIGQTAKGNVRRMYGHGLDTAWLGVDNVEIVAVADPDEEGRAAAAQRLDARRTYADYREMLEKERPQIVSIAPLQMSAHRDVAIACAEAGAHMFLEKPMCRSLAEADDIVAAAEQHHVKVALAHQTRYNPRVERVRELIADGRLGDLIELRGRGKEDGRGGGMDLLILGTHILDLMRLFAGDAQWCFARVSQEGRLAKPEDVQSSESTGPTLGDQVWATFGFANGVVGTFGSSKARHGARSRFGLQIYGTRGAVQLWHDAQTAYFLDDPSWFPGKRGAAWQEVTSAGLGLPEPLGEYRLLDGNQRIVRDLMEAIEHDRQPLGSAYDGRSSLEMVLAVYESYRLSKPVNLPLKNRCHPLTTFRNHPNREGME